LWSRFVSLRHAASVQQVIHALGNENRSIASNPPHQFCRNTMAAGVDGIIRGDTDDGSIPPVYRDEENGVVAPPQSTGASFRRGGRYCGCCCDYRRAVLIIDNLLWFVSFLSFIYAVAVEENLFQLTTPQSENEEDFNEMQEQLKESSLFKFGMAANALNAIIFLPCSLYGAWRFKWAWVVPFCAWFIITEIISLFLTQKFCEGMQTQNNNGSAGNVPSCQSNVYSYTFQVVMMLLILYPHLVFIRQCRRGILNPDTYHSHEKSCCCCA
jgi:hypothetical protein